jgi:hypothetical protein
MHGRYESNQAEIMIPMQVTQKDMINFIDLDFQFAEPELGSFTTVNHKMGIVYQQYLGCLVAVECRRCRI